MTRRTIAIATRFAAVLALVIAGLAVAPNPASAGPGWPASNRMGAYANGNTCLDLDSGTENAVKTNVQLLTCRSYGDQFVDYQRWWVTAVPGREGRGEYKIVNLRTGKCLTYYPKSRPGSPVFAQSCDQPGQGWWLGDSAVGDVTDYYVAVETTGFCLGIRDWQGSSRTGILLAECQPRGLFNRWVLK